MHAKIILLVVALSAIASHAAALPGGTQEMSVGVAEAQIMGMAAYSLYRREERDSSSMMAKAVSTNDATAIATVTKESKNGISVAAKNGDCDDDDDEDDDDDDDDDDESRSRRHHGSSESSSGNHGGSQSHHNGQNGDDHDSQPQHDAGGDHRNNEPTPTNSAGQPGPSVSHRPSSAIKTTLKSQSVVIASLLTIVVTGYLL
ncbi:hypothetical protein EMPS_04971 [Entomortierella parvispora]|uniref:Uncharacterized protein n=1 Tax=Entomortierella parvispora TaxID=205924 RepID=A0A9P3HA02_9FUNG|nr:hypothetical protein EMPS_04971 [Entomortierella parvispora]